MELFNSLGVLTVFYLCFDLITMALEVFHIYVHCVV